MFVCACLHKRDVRVCVGGPGGRRRVGGRRLDPGVDAGEEIGLMCFLRDLR